ncbi:MAG: hypothetical protein GYB67_15040 [Chloroflexi bacterium]|nr:hypothetical protein [Chloroflexota bacterium]
MMNDELSGQLTDTWAIPAYARDFLWLETDSGTFQTEGAHGLFRLPAPAELLTLRWGDPAGPALTRLRWRPDSLEWDGAVRVGGYIDALHITELDALPEPLVILHIGGQPLKPDVRPYPTRTERRRVPYTIPGFQDGLADEVSETITTWMALETHPALTLAQDALVSKLRLYSFGRLAADESGWHDLFALPIALEGLTLFAP